MQICTKNYNLQSAHEIDAQQEYCAVGGGVGGCGGDWLQFIEILIERIKTFIQFSIFNFQQTWTNHRIAISYHHRILTYVQRA